MSAGLALVPAAYLLGSIPFSLWIGRLWSGRDLRQIGSGNPGATNVLRVAGKLPAVLALLADVGKGALPVLVGQRLGLAESTLALAGLAAVVGHVFPLFLGFRGGKGVATACGTFLAQVPPIMFLALAIFLLVVAWRRYVSLASIVAAPSVPVLWAAAGLFGDYGGAVSRPSPATLASSAAVAALIVWRHRGNVRRLRSGTEPRLGERTSGDKANGRVSNGAES